MFVFNDYNFSFYFVLSNPVFVQRPFHYLSISLQIIFPSWYNYNIIRNLAPLLIYSTPASLQYLVICSKYTLKSSKFRIILDLFLFLTLHIVQIIIQPNITGWTNKIPYSPIPISNMCLPKFRTGFPKFSFSLRESIEWSSCV